VPFNVEAGISGRTGFIGHAFIFLLVCLSLLFFFALFGLALFFITLILVHFVLFSLFFLRVVFIFLEHLLIRVDFFTACNQEQVPLNGIGTPLSFSLVVFFKNPGTGS
jgi:hypothetical protein